jgi:hypothetical protein
MARGLALPVGVDGTGGAAVVEGEDNDRKIIFTALCDCDSEHAFQQDLGLGSGMVFDINDEVVRASILSRAYDIFDQFEKQKRYKLKKDSIKWTTDAVKQELVLEFMYVNLESDEEKVFMRRFTSTSSEA